MTRTDKDGNTPLHLCCKNGHTAVIQEFLDILKVDGVLKIANRSVANETYMIILDVNYILQLELSIAHTRCPLLVAFLQCAKMNFVTQQPFLD